MHTNHYSPPLPLPFPTSILSNPFHSERKRPPMGSGQSLEHQIEAGSSPSLLHQGSSCTSCTRNRSWPHCQGPIRQTNLHNCHPHTEGLVQFHACSIAVCLESINSHELGSAVPVSFLFMSLTSLVHTISSPFSSIGRSELSLVIGSGSLHLFLSYSRWRFYDDRVFLIRSQGKSSLGVLIFPASPTLFYVKLYYFHLHLIGLNCLFKSDIEV